MPVAIIPFLQWPDGLGVDYYPPEDPRGIPVVQRTHLLRRKLKLCRPSPSFHSREHELAGCAEWNPEASWRRDCGADAPLPPLCEECLAIVEEEGC